MEGGGVKKGGGGGKERGGDEKATRREEEEERTQEIKTFSYREASVRRGPRSPAIGTKKLTHVYAHTQFNQRGGEAAIIIIFFLKSLSLSSVP